MVDIDPRKVLGDLIYSTLTEFIEKELKTTSFEFKLSSATKQGDNFIGIVHRVTYNKIDENIKNQEFTLILKVAPTNLARRESFFSRPTFLREIYSYTKILPYFRTFEESKGIIIDENGFKEYPKCYKTIDVEPNESLFLQDLKTDGFSMIDIRQKMVSADHMELVMKALGKFHAISFALKDQDPDKLTELTSNLDEILYRSGQPKMSEYFKMLQTPVYDAISDDKYGHLVDKVERALQNDPLTVVLNCIGDKSVERYAVICHADCWTNNTLFKSDANGKPTEVSLVDWQIARYCSPVTDILYYLFSCTTKEIRDKHYDALLKTYHDSLSNHLKRLGSDPATVFPYEVMLEHFQKFGKFGLIMAMMVVPMMLSEDGIADDLDEFAEQVKDGLELDISTYVSEKSQPMLHQRLRDIVIDMAQLKYI